MAPERIAPLARAVAALLSRGRDPDARTTHFLESTFGTADPAALAGLLDDPEGHEAALLADYLLFPRPVDRAGLEEALSAADLAPDKVPDLARAVAALLGDTARLAPASSRAGANQAEPPAGSPGRPFVPVRLSGGALRLPLAPEALARFVERLRPGHTPPPELAAALASRLPRPQALAARAALRQARLDFDPPQVAFLRALIDRLPGPGKAPDPRFDLPPLPGQEPAPLPAPPATPPALPEVLAYAAALLERAEPGEPPLALLARRARELDLLLRQAERLDQARSQGSFEFLSASGLRAPHLHAPDLHRELTLLDATSRALTGRSAQSLDAPVERDLGACEDLRSLLDLLAGE
jgi:hypothetical protein